MKLSLVAIVVALGVAFNAVPASAQDAPAEEDNSALQKILQTELSPERMALAMKLVALSGTTRIFDEVLPDVAEQSKTNFIRANPQMQLGIIAVVDRVALDLVKRRPELDQYLARIWASGFSDDEMQELIDFYSSDVGKKFSNALPQLLAVQTAAANEWGRDLATELNQRVQDELKAAMAAEQEALQSDIAGPATDQTQPAPQQ
jgi:hypothetical protein